MTWVLDLDGVVGLASKRIPGASAAVARLRAAGERVVFVTNNSFAPVADVEAKLAEHGIEASGGVVTSAQAAARLIEPDERVLVCGGPGAWQAVVERGARPVDGLDEQEVDVVLVGYHREFDYERMRVATTAVRRGARLIATNDDATYPTPSGPIPGGGAILASIVTGSGQAPDAIAGKGYRPMADLVRNRYGTDGWVVGDRPETDGRFARTLGYRFALVLTGVTSEADLPVRPTPDLIAPDLAAAVDATTG
jgi:HAD superfamily hydrolase (TIGR01450 family)